MITSGSGKERGTSVDGPVSSVFRAIPHIHLSFNLPIDAHKPLNFDATRALTAAESDPRQSWRKRVAAVHGIATVDAQVRAYSTASSDPHLLRVGEGGGCWNL